MDSTLTQSQFPHRISLSQAAEISGYHQDYLGQLCRMGKIRADKIGRNWYTTQTELKILLSGQGLDLEDSDEDTGSASEVVMEQVQSVKQVTPIQRQVTDIVKVRNSVVVDSEVISEVEGMDIALRTQVPARAEHSVQSLITRMKLDSLKQEVLQIAVNVQSINQKLVEHEQMIHALASQAKQKIDLTENFSPSLSVVSRTVAKPEGLITVIDAPEAISEPAKQWVWLWPALAVMLVAIPIGILALLPEMQVPSVAQTIYYHQNDAEVVPQVAGDSVTIQE